MEPGEDIEDIDEAQAVGDARHGCELVAGAQLRYPTAGNAAPDRSLALPPRHKLPRVGRGRYRRRGCIGATLNTATVSRVATSTMCAAAILMVIILIVLVCEYSSSRVRRWVQ